MGLTGRQGCDMVVGMKKVLVADYAKSLGVSTKMVYKMGQMGKLNIERISRRTAFVIIPDSEQAEKTTKLDKLNTELEELTIRLKIKETQAKLDGIVDQTIIDKVKADRLELGSLRDRLQSTSDHLTVDAKNIAKQSAEVAKKQLEWKSYRDAIQRDYALMRGYYKEIQKQHPGVVAVLEPKLEMDWEKK